MHEDEHGMKETTTKVTPLSTVAVASAVLTAGGLLGGMSYYHGTTKQLIEEGIDPRARLKAVPVAVRFFMRMPFTSGNQMKFSRIQLSQSI